MLAPDLFECCTDQPIYSATAPNDANDILVLLPGNSELCGPVPNGTVFKVATMPYASPYSWKDVKLPAC